MIRLFSALGLDYEQWRALTRAALKVDFRASSFMRTQFGGDTRAAGALIGQAIFYTVMGGFIAAFVWFSRDVFVAGSVVATYVMFMVGTAALLDHNAAIASPDDYMILGFRPITSRTYFAARLTNVLIYTTAMTTVFAYLPVASFFIRHGFAVGLAGLVSVYAASVTVTLTMVVAYAGLMRYIGAARLKRVLSYVQFLFSFLVYGGFFLFSRLVSESAFSSFAFEKSPWILLLPPTWFASYLDLAAGRTSALEIVPALASLAALSALALAIAGRLSLDYADRLGAIATASATASNARAPRKRRSWWFTQGEARATALLIRGQFRNDMKFRMGVLAILPLTIIYLLIGLTEDGTLGDPFVRGGVSQGLMMVTLAMLMFPTMLKMNLTMSDSFRASWIFFACPADRTRIVRAAKNVLVVSFLIPYMALVGALLAWFSTNAAHILVHLVVIALVSHLVLQIVTLVEPELPFSKPVVKGRSSSRVMLLMVVVGVGVVIVPLTAPFVYRSTIATSVLIAGLIAASAVLDRITRLRIESQAAQLEFQG